MSEYTHGPWEIGRNDGFAVPINAESERAFDLATVHNGGNDIEAMANAVLIAAAPSMIADHRLNAADATAALNLWRLKRHGTDPTRVIEGMLSLLRSIRDRSEASIAKAEGAN